MNILRMLFATALTASAAPSSAIVYQGDSGPGKGRHIVFLASDHEYRAEEACPALARILAKHHGFKCTVVFGVEKEGFIEAGSSRVAGLEALERIEDLPVGFRLKACQSPGFLLSRP